MKYILIWFNSNSILCVSKSFQFNSNAIFQLSKQFLIRFQFIMHQNAKVAKMDKIIFNSIPIPMHHNNTDPYLKKSNYPPPS